MTTLSGGESPETKGGKQGGDERGDDRVGAREKKPSLAILGVTDAQPHQRLVVVVRTSSTQRPGPDLLWCSRGRPWANDVWGPRAVLPVQPRRAGYWPPQ